MTKFSDWLQKQSEAIGGAKGLVAAMPDHNHGNVLAWLAGIREPGWKIQFEISELFGVSVAEIRDLMGLPTTPFAEWLAKKIFAQTTALQFSLNSDICKSRLDKWLSGKQLPSNSQWGVESAELRMIRDGIIAIGDPTSKEVLMAELALVIAQSRELRASQGVKFYVKQRPEISTVCNSAKIAA